jgi:hypothetical protein
VNAAAATNCFAFVLSAFVIAGVAQTIWFRSKHSKRLMQPLDFGCRLRGRRLFGDNKTVRGFVVFVPAVAGMFALNAWLWGASAPWDRSISGYAVVGGIAGLGFMLGELPNSFIKRQLGISSGQPASGAWRVVFTMVDRIDSILGMLIALSLCVSVPVQIWVAFLVIGPVIHLGFSALMFRVGVKVRAA